MHSNDGQTEVVVSIMASLKDYLQSKDFEFLFSMGSKLSFVAYTLDGSSDAKLRKIIPSLIQFTEIIHQIAKDKLLVSKYEDIVDAYLKELAFWLQNYFIEDKPEVLPSNIIDVLVSSVENIALLLSDNGNLDSNLDDIFFD